MNEDIKTFIKDKKLASHRVFRWIGTYNKTELSLLLKISRPTLDRRLEQDNWRLREIELIVKHLPSL